MCALAGADQGERRFVSIYRKATQTGGVRDEEDEEIVTSEQLQSAEVALQAERARVRRRDRNFRTRASRKGTGPLSLRAIDCLHFVYYSHGKKQMREKVGMMMFITIFADDDVYYIAGDYRAASRGKTEERKKT